LTVQLFHIFKYEDHKGIGLKSYLRVQTELHVVKAKHLEFDLFFCAKCHKFKNYQSKSNPVTPEEIAMEAAYANYIPHVELVKKQWSLYQEILNSLNAERTTALVVIDFTKKFTQGPKAVICSMVIFRKRCDQVNWIALDFCGKSGSETADNYFLAGTVLLDWVLSVGLRLFMCFMTKAAMSSTTLQCSISIQVFKQHLLAKFALTTLKVVTESLFAMPTLDRRHEKETICCIF
jgi:hypothetical protein